MPRSNVNFDDVTINNVTFWRKMAFFRPSDRKKCYKGWLSPQENQFRVIFMHIFSIIFLKFDTVDNIWRNSDLWKKFLYVIVGINIFFLLSNQKSFLCHGINCGSYENGTLAVAVHLEMNAVAPCGFIVEACNRVVNMTSLRRMMYRYAVCR